MFQRIGEFFGSVGWRVVNLKYGKLLEAAFAGPAGEALQRWIDDCPNQRYSALAFKGAAAVMSPLRTRTDFDISSTFPIWRGQPREP